YGRATSCPANRQVVVSKCRHSLGSRSIKIDGAPRNGGGDTTRGECPGDPHREPVGEYLGLSVEGQITVGSRRHMLVSRTLVITHCARSTAANTAAAADKR